MATFTVESSGFRASDNGYGYVSASFDDIRHVSAEPLDGFQEWSLTLRFAYGELTTFLPPRVAKAMADAFAKAMAEEREEDCLPAA